ncbi:MAG: FkbM family methyltransferase [Verrucomicrobia bacterium]|nr:FkbM family methyltransferase [Verrucomicrobiota bacterium]
MNLTQAAGFFRFLAHFENAALVFALRMGWVRLPLFLYRLRNGAQTYEFLARPRACTGSDLFILREALVDESYREILPLLGKAPLRMVDLGANLGAVTVWFHRVHGLREAFCFEPDADSFQLCEFNLRRNECHGATAYPHAVSATSGEANISTDPDRPAQSSLYRKDVTKNPGSQTVKVVAFAEWLEEHPGDFDLLKCDCEGAEWAILEKTPECFARFKVVVIEVHRNPISQRPLSDFPDVLSRQGFTTLRWDGHCNGLYIGQRASG